MMKKKKSARTTKNKLSIGPLTLTEKKKRAKIAKHFFGPFQKEICDKRLCAHLKNVLVKLPWEALDILMSKRKIIIIQPYSGCTTIDFMPSTRIMVFMSNLCDKPVHEITYNIAHEFAHVYLDHSNDNANIVEDEFDTDRQVIEWGFEDELKKTPYNYLYGPAYTPGWQKTLSDI